ncbi:penicillin-binding protein 1A [Alkalisalibacterium limincola]|uniref:Penicillin-binding protein 1A n=1 Tax=Alkalisalibacterium limincola TaxID=2699169 RepID=A0A5C8KR95_9GAMM|nr:penicillin-binding protein 1A [Alkalisalibacterium limincola]TXK62520.1 penicillin-binding protein 1A [Alkalisalibacterium limincola]
MPRIRRLIKWTALLGLLVVCLGVAGVGVLYWLIAPRLPDVHTLRTIELQVPMSVYDSEGRMIAQFGETRRYPVSIEEVPAQVRQAFIAIEDARFYEHPGIDWRGITRAVWLLATTDGRRVPGGSTITQQVARQFFLSPEYSYTRKATEIFLALKMERELSKDEILELYLNKSFFGNRAYGIAAAAEFYYGKSLDELTLDEAATLASIPKFPSSGNPIVNPQRALIRRNYVLHRMHEVGFIDQTTLSIAQALPITARPHEPPVEIEAPYVAEMVRQAMTERFGADVLNAGYQVHTTIDGDAQEAANLALRESLFDYDRRHGYRGPEAQWEIEDASDIETLAARLRGIPVLGTLQPGLVLESSAGSATVLMRDGAQVEIPLQNLGWARPYIDANRRGAAPQRASDVMAPGDVVRVRPPTEEIEGWRLAQIPAVQGAFVGLDSESGALRALVGGFSFGANKFNRATQAQRPPGSSFKPFVYAAAFERGFHPASIVLDAPVVFVDRAGNEWRPQNDNRTFAGPMRLRNALVTSRNLVSVRLLDAIGVNYAHRYILNFGFRPQSIPENLSMSLGTAALSPMEVATGYAPFVNGGYLVEPWFIERVVDRDGTVVEEANPALACARCPERGGRNGAAPTAIDGFDLGPAPSAAPAEERPESDDLALANGEAGRVLAEQAIDPRTAFLINSMLRDVVRRGTGRGALVLGREDLGGKTGSTNEHRDAWFAGFGDSLVGVAWVGMDDFSTLGAGEFGARAALPIWNGFMGAALEDVAEREFEPPEGVTTAWINPESGWLVPAGTPGAISEFFKSEDLNRMQVRDPAEEQRATQQEAFEIF